MSYITFKNICKSYDNKTQVLKGIDLEVEKGELLTLLGPVSYTHLDVYKRQAEARIQSNPWSLWPRYLW